VTHDPRKRHCVDCGAEFEPTRRDAEFCSAPCRVEFNKRRQLRGMILYDLMMINRNERKLAKAARVWFLITRLCMYWRLDDQRERGGRRSWRKASKVLEASAWARATVMDRK